MSAVRRLSHLVHVIRDQHRATVDQTPHRPAVRELALLRIDALRKHRLFLLSQRQFVGRREPTPAPRLGFPSPSLLTLLLRL